MPETHHRGQRYVPCHETQCYLPASITGWLILNSFVSGVENTGGEDGIVEQSFKVSSRGSCGRLRFTSKPVQWGLYRSWILS